ncbi:amidohydrolase family protein [Rhizobium leguminosarum bv. viciae]|uniref:Amidohydrolase family protein n=1 Tax=Rhizobium leguminosarum bv. viciae TaxID=387 RepID=A0A8I2GSD7_RHILV|nr:MULTISPECIES: amidohydrolase family protein [Rhizobium]MBY3171507.1 amidohydrolase family protein [Rhizobium laguerreae]MBY5419972.1 amidohydrolase family protein [Rhizobium leguminosarum]MBY5427119.1 amidohydrolase family protein [Rhizobium leguminosarum]MBY5793976.1 amidohydrolase family protein [Rhizobium leguminosarum]NKK29947.1 amidohydrolase family protein [Rhizobium leguminosarum bv. viciae]
MIIDAHQHFWDLETGIYDWMTGTAMAPIRRNFGPHHLQPLMAEAQVDKTIVIQCRHDLEETRDFLAIASKYDFVVGVVGWVDLKADDIAQEIAALRALPGGEYLVGIRHIVHDEPDADWLLRPAVQRGIGAVIEAGLTYDLLARTREMAAATALAKTFPKGRFVLDHLAKPPIASGSTNAWQTEFEKIAALDNVWCKISGMVTEADWTRWRPEDFDTYTRLALEMFGPDRIIFGSDWPVCTLAADYKDVKAIAHRLAEIDPGIAERFYHFNAVAAYRLSDQKTGTP